MLSQPGAVSLFILTCVVQENSEQKEESSVTQKPGTSTTPEDLDDEAYLMVTQVSTQTPGTNRRRHGKMSEVDF